MAFYLQQTLFDRKTPTCKVVEDTNIMDQVELVDFDPNWERWHHYNEAAYDDDEHHLRGGVQWQIS